MSKLLSQGGYGCVYYPGISCTGETSNDKKYISKPKQTNYGHDVKSLLVKNKLVLIIIIGILLQLLIRVL